ncbi:hypothetical protein RCO48_04475 [Peribacillus frigoritolerans]|nr:hypothetical protein [Peribacillus frigoritolerans]
MGRLYDAVQSQNQMKRNFVLGRLKELKVTHSQEGQPIELLDYDELKYELVLAELPLHGNLSCLCKMPGRRVK